jgi:hypothetical protein
MTRKSGWLIAALTLAALKLIVGLAGFLAPPTSVPAAVTPFPAWIHALHIVVFGAAAAILIFGGRRDRRAIHLAGVYLLFATVFADRTIFRLASAADAPWSTALLWLRAIRLDAFTPALQWLFFRDFPVTAPFGWARRLPRIFVPTSLVAGSVLLAVNFAGEFGINSAPLLRADSPEGSLYWTVQLGLTLPAFMFAIWKMRMARLDERRRVRLFVAGLAAGALPMLVDVLVETLVAPFHRWMDQPSVRPVSGVIFYPLLLSIPFTTTYSVLVDHVLDVRLVVRRAIQYGLARYTAMAALAIPFAALVLYLFRHRGETIVALFSGARPFLLLAATGVGLVTVGMRRWLLAAVDRRFFREQYDARRVLTELAESSRRAASAQELSALLVARVDAALHLDSIAVLVVDPLTGQLVAGEGRIRPLSVSSALATLAAGDVRPLDIDLEDARSPLRRLPEDERQWLADGGFRLLVPFLGSDGSLLGLFALGEKKSELPFDGEDRELLTALAGSTSLTLENRLLHESPVGRLTPRADDAGDVRRLAPEMQQEFSADECPRCGAVYPHPIPACASCAAVVMPALIPYVLSGKFRFERRIGQGGMGVVYRATDLVLQRPVAVKTLPRISPEAALRLRREARAAARIVHPGLAQIFGAETWRGTPMLIFEFLEAGTLAERLAVRPLSPVETVRMGVAVADVLERAHASGILHADIKPSNIGYRSDGSVAVLDFGVARMLGRSEAPLPMVPTLTRDVSNLTTGYHLVPEDAVLVELKDLAGTLAYVSPEALTGAPVDPAFDLWSLAVVLYEAVTGLNPFSAAGIVETTSRIRASVVPPIRDYSPTCPPELAAFIHDALHPDRTRRPSTAREFRSLLHHAAAL